MLLLCWPFHFNLGFNLQFECGIMDIINALIAALGFGFAIYQFKKQNEDNRISTADQNNKNWYLSVLVIPHLERINVFFEETVKALKVLKENMDNTDLLQRSREQRFHNDNINAFFAPLEASMASYNERMRSTISDLGLALQDEVTKIISDSNVEPADLERRVMEYKGQLIGLLYQPINDTVA